MTSKLTSSSALNHLISISSIAWRNSTIPLHGRPPSHSSLHSRILIKAGLFERLPSTRSLVCDLRVLDVKDSMPSLRKGEDFKGRWELERNKPSAMYEKSCVIA